MPTPSLGSTPRPQGALHFFDHLFLFLFFLVIKVGCTFISVAIVANIHIHCPPFQQQQKDNSGLLYMHDVFHMCLDFEDMHVVSWDSARMSLEGVTSIQGLDHHI